MLINFFTLLGGKPRVRPPPGPFVQDVTVTTPPEPRSRRSEWLLIVCWVLIVAKAIGVYWLVDTYHVPVHPLWVIGPTVLFAGLSTAIYLARTR